MQSYKETKQLYYLIIRVPRDEAYFIYFTLESNEGLAYYSTTDSSLKGPYRDIEIKTTIENQKDLESLIERLQQELRLDILEKGQIKDS